MKFILLSAVGVLLLAGWSHAQEVGGGVGSVQETSLGPDLGASYEVSRTAEEMETFAFPNIYNSAVFYATYKGAMFLQNQQNVLNILSGSRLLHARMETMTPGQALLIEGMAINQDTPLIIKKNGLIEDSDVDGKEFTFRRLLCLTATYLHENRDKFPALYKSLKTEVLRLIENNAKNPNTNTIKTFVFSKTEIPHKFDYEEFYNKYKGATFLQDKQNVENILNKVHELRHQVDALAAGEALQMEGMFLEPNSSTPLVLHKSYRFDESDVAGSDFTLRRLSGLTVLYVWYNRGKFPDLCASEPNALGIDWRYPELYLSAVSGAELFVGYFILSYPLICALRRYQLKQISEVQLMQVAMTRRSDGYTQAEKYKKFKTSYDNRVPADFKWDKLVNTLPEHIKLHFTD